MEKKKYFVNVGTHEISQIEFGNNVDFIVYATDDDVRLLRAKMDNMHEAGIGTFFRAHVPIMSYHKDKSNENYDQGITEAFQMIHELGDEQTKKHIESMDVLGDRHM